MWGPVLSRSLRSGCRIGSSSSGHGAKRFVSSHRLAYASYGEPSDVIRKEGLHIDKVEPEEILVKMVASPVNPADINTIQGTYPIKPKSLPAVPGNEGVGIVVKVGDGPNPFKFTPGQWVIPEHPGVGTWQGYAVGKNEDFLPIPEMDLACAATISVNPPTAYRMLKDYENLNPGDVVVQNGGNSAVGQAVIQFCRVFGLKSVSIVRNRENFSQLKDRLLALGDSNTSIITEEELRTFVGKSVQAQLALNCAGGKSATDILRVLEPGRTHVTYGGMSRQPVIVPTSHLIFNDIKLRGFWMSRWSKNNSIESRLEMFNIIGKLCKEGKFTAPAHKMLPLAKYREALENAMKGFNETKYIITFD